MAALVGGDLLIDGEGHGFDGGARLANGVLIGWGACLLGIDGQQGTQFTGDDFGRARLAEEGQQFLLALLLIRGPELLVVGEREAPLADLSLLGFGQRPQPFVEPVDDGVRPLLEPLRRRGLHKPRGFGVVLLQGCFESTHLAGIDGGEDDAAVGDDPVEEVGAQAIVIGIDPVDVLVRESPFESLPALHEKGFVLRKGFVPMPGQQRREPLCQVVALVCGEIEVVIGSPEDDPVRIAIERDDREVNNRRGRITARRHTTPTGRSALPSSDAVLRSES